MRVLPLILASFAAPYSVAAIPNASHSPDRGEILLAPRDNANYYDLGLTEPLCVPTNGFNLCTNTLVGREGLDDAWIYTFDDACEMLFLDSRADWNRLGNGPYQFSPRQLDVTASVHSNKTRFMLDMIDNDFWVVTNGKQQNWLGD